jgi:hypothetical protein
MDEAAGGRPRHRRSGAVLDRLGLLISRSAGDVFPARMRVGVQVSLLLLLLVGCAMADRRGSSQQASDRQGMVAVHPEWPPEIRGAVASGVISDGMTTDMVRAAWGRPTRVASNGSGLHQRDTWYYTGRQHNANMIGGQTGGVQPLAEWTVVFADGCVVGWTD